ncbi:MAG: exonuclease subunit SbcD [Hyphomicrobiaceae bacterium]|nr:exonuclease subunit SbcD [Hyphomicrobiaceae bacterium]MCC0009265.1 exonuclease subunit SbcD [Hyphomicrobiaceae bacterium]
MKLLHTADLHLGRHFLGNSLANDHAAVLAQILKAVDVHQPDAVIIAGDIFDRAAAPETAVGQFNDFLNELSACERTAIVLIAGNHDSGERIEAMSMLANAERTLVRGVLKAEEPALLLRDEAGPVAISGLPFAYEYAARDCFGDKQIKAPADVVRAQITAARSRVPKGARWVVVAHTFVDGGDASDSERPLTRAIGGIETVPWQVFDGAHYVALGHLHRPQSVGRAHVRYAGAPLAFGFDEAGQEKSMTLVDLRPDGRVELEVIPFHPLRNVRTLTGHLDDLLGSDVAGTEDFIQVVLTDEHRRIDPIKRLWERFPNVCDVRYAGLETKSADGSFTVTPDRLERPSELVGAFLDYVRGRSPSDEEARLIAEELGQATTINEDAA